MNNKNKLTKGRTMKIAIPITNGELCAHFGHCERFALIEVDETKKIQIGRQDTDAPPHQPGILPVWLAEQGANIIIAGGMGQRAQMLFKENNIDVIIGVPSDKPDVIVKQYLNGTLATGTNFCDH